MSKLLTNGWMPCMDAIRISKWKSIKPWNLLGGSAMELTRRKAISECKKLWKEIKESGLSKVDFLKTKQGKKWKEKGFLHDCPLCELEPTSDDNFCDTCPLKEQYHMSCYELGYVDRGICSPLLFEAIEGLK